MSGLLAALPQADMGLLASAAVVYGVGRLVPTYDMGWYKALRKPSWNPPNWVFPAVWLPLKLLQSVALWLVCKTAPDNQSLALPVAAFGIHLALGNAWNTTFFGRHKMQESLKVMGTFWASIAATISAFSFVNPLAAWLMVPTQVWVTIASKLNYDIVKLNTKP
ncbi:hypothetical protein N2152v2_009593 [Parachlorella kessleri]